MMSANLPDPLHRRERKRMADGGVINPSSSSSLRNRWRRRMLLVLTRAAGSGFEGKEREAKTLGALRAGGGFYRLGHRGVKRRCCSTLLVASMCDRG